MNKETVLIATIALLVGVMGGYGVGSAAKHMGYGGDGERYGTGEKYDRDYSMGMGMMGGYDDWEDHSEHMGMMVTSEEEFLTEMIPHHQEAVDTAKEVLARGATTPEIKALVENIVTAQEREIAEMKQWYQDWYGATYEESGDYKPMMRELEGLSGEAIDRAFLSDMIMHHMGAIMMARSVQPYLEHEEIKSLTAAIISTQSDEIAQMQEMLRNL